ncbi:SUKH-3 domain-containing protein [Solwaraspora sp. WMMB335]|uniref:SUKH-3 domain-containing protein n=1 Tax=Solwaraspora sp. WMMB335 TaxID=3404118 RepID=UPI003B940EEC
MISGGRTGDVERFPPAVAAVLSRAGWHAGRRDDGRARDWALRVAGHVAPDGRQHHVVGPAFDAYAEYGGLRVEPPGSGEQIAPSTFHLDPMRAVHTVATLGGLGAALRQPLSPLGVTTDGPGILAIDALGRVFVLDHGGDWYLGPAAPEAITALVLGLRPARVDLDGTW